MKARIAVVGAGVYGATIALRMASAGYRVTVFDPAGILQCASSINQFRIHSGYHYPRSAETIEEIRDCRSAFLKAYGSCVVNHTTNYYAIPRHGSKTSPDEFVNIARTNKLEVRAVRPAWMDFSYIDQCWQVDESLYDPERLRELIVAGFVTHEIEFRRQRFLHDDAASWDFVVWACYGLYDDHSPFKNLKVQVAEKVLIQLPVQLQRMCLVVIDGPFTAFDSYGNTSFSQFGSAALTNHWSGNPLVDSIPEEFARRLNRPAFEVMNDTRFAEMRAASALAVPASLHASYLGSKFTLRVVEDRSCDDRRVLQVLRVDDKNVHVFSGKVVAAPKAADQVAAMIAE